MIRRAIRSPKAVIAVAITALITLASTVLAQTHQTFTDVPLDHPQFEAIEWAKEVGVTAGYGDGTFRPAEPLSKSHALIFVERYYDEILKADRSESFTRGDMMSLLYDIASPGPTEEVAEPVTVPDHVDHPVIQSAFTLILTRYAALSQFLSGIEFSTDITRCLRWGAVACAGNTNLDNGRVTDSVHVRNWDQQSPALFIHEIGHTLEQKAIRLMSATHDGEGSSLSIFHDLTSNFKEYCKDISDYACTHRQEYTAESFLGEVHGGAAGIGQHPAAERLVDHLVYVVTEGPCLYMVRTDESANGYVPDCGAYRQ